MKITNLGSSLRATASVVRGTFGGEKKPKTTTTLADGTKCVQTLRRLADNPKDPVERSALALLGSADVTITSTVWDSGDGQTKRDKEQNVWPAYVAARTEWLTMTGEMPSEGDWKAIEAMALRIDPTFAERRAMEQAAFDRFTAKEREKAEKEAAQAKADEEAKSKKDADPAPAEQPVSNGNGRAHKTAKV